MAKRLEGKRIAFLAADGFEQSELEQPWNEIKNAGATVELTRRGERVAQLVVQPVVQARFIETEVVSKTDRGAGGFGSTGTAAEPRSRVAAKKKSKPAPKARAAAKPPPRPKQRTKR